MKSDMSRVTFDPTRHYKRVPLQQGRVQTDADTNEQQAITVHRVETEAVDLIGGCGGPLHHAGFEITPDGDDLRIGAGRYYVHGVLTENEDELGYEEQPDYPLGHAWLAGLADPPVLSLPPADGAYLAYLDVWERHLTALEAPHIREVALGGPDTATRVKTLWQVKLHPLEAGDPAPADLTCLSDVPSFVEATAPSTGELGARAEVSAPSDDPCIVKPGAGYRRLENQLYRVEVHTGGERNDTVWKWDRDNGTILARLEAQSATLEEWTVSSVGRDEVLRFAPGDLVEITDDSHELHGRPGTLVRVDSVEGRVITVDLSAPLPSGGSVDMADFPDNPKVRRWNGVLEGVTNQDWRELEDGVQVRLRGGNGADGLPRRYRTGDWWTIPARTNTGDVEWPTENDGWRLAEGIHHDYCRLAVLEYAGGAWSVTDCRPLFPPVTELTSLFYVGGDGQECMPGEELDLSLRVGVANGSHPVEGARIRFTVGSGSAEIAATSGGAGAAELEVVTDADGLAECFWSPADDPLTVDAVLLDVADDPVHVPVRFGANLSTADAVAYTPVDGCAMPETVTTVQEALDELCLRESEGGCAVTIAPGEGWQARAEAALELADDLHLCFQAGEYTTDRALEIVDKGHISITGCGPATRFRNEEGETVFDVDECASIHFADFHAEAAFAGDLGDEPAAEHLNGVLNVLNCGNATVERVSLLCAAGGRRAVTGITVRETRPGEVDGHHSTRIRSCDVGIGHRQTGILVVNTERAVVEDNHLWVRPRPEGFGVVEAVEHDGHLERVVDEALLIQPRVDDDLGARFPRSAVRRALLRAGIQEDAAEVRRDVTLGAQFVVTLSFFTPQSLVQTWEAVLDEHPVETGRTAESVEQHLHTLVARTLDGSLQGDAAAALAAWADDLVRAMPPVASQGIVVAKNEPRPGALPSPDLRILNNRIEGCQQGIHLGASHEREEVEDQPTEPTEPTEPTDDGTGATPGVGGGGLTAGDLTAGGNALVTGVVDGGMTNIGFVGNEVILGDAFGAVTPLVLRRVTEAALAAGDFAAAAPDDPCAHDALDTVIVQGNAVDVVLSPETSRQRHGIFVGNARHITVQDNRVRVYRTVAGGVWRIEGIRAWGYFGSMVIVRQNHTEGADVGIRVQPVGAGLCSPDIRHWYVADNVALGAEPGVEAPSSVVQERNMA